MKRWEDECMIKREEELTRREGRGIFSFFAAVVLVIVTVCVIGLGGNKSGSSAKYTSEPVTRSSTYNNRYRSGAGTGTGNGTKSYSSGTGTKKSTTVPQKKPVKKNTSNRNTAKKNTAGKKSPGQKAYDDFMDDAQEDYLSCVDSDEEYWDAVENFDEGWLTPDERDELDKLMESYKE